MNYQTFFNVFLAEMPWRIAGGNAFDAQLKMLKENQSNYPENQKSIGNNVYKITVGDQSTYWTGSGDLSDVAVIVDTENDGKFCKVVLTSKNPSMPHGAAPYTSDLYLAIKKDIGTLNMVFTSDNMLSDDAMKLWDRLLSQGYALSVYDTSTHQYALDHVKSTDELGSYFGDIDKQKYVYVLSENVEITDGLKHSIAIMEIKRNALYPLFEEFRKK